MKGNIIVVVAMAVGGWIGNRLKLPSGWLTGAMVAGLGVKAFLPANLPSGELVSIGSQLLVAYLIVSTSDIAMIRQHPEVVPIALGFVAVLVAFCFAAAWALNRWFGVDLATAVFATAPGGLSGLAVQATDAGAQTPVSVIFHLFRLVLVLVTTPFLVALAAR